MGAIEDLRSCRMDTSDPDHYKRDTAATYNDAVDIGVLLVGMLVRSLNLTQTPIAREMGSYPVYHPEKCGALHARLNDAEQQFCLVQRAVDRHLKKEEADCMRSEDSRMQYLASVTVLNQSLDCIIRSVLLARMGGTPEIRSRNVLSLHQHEGRLVAVIEAPPKMRGMFFGGNEDE